jgi:hypothetical protein
VTDPLTGMPRAMRLVPDEAECHICLHTRSIGELGQEMIDSDTMVWRCRDNMMCAAIMHVCAQGLHEHKPMHRHHMRAAETHAPHDVPEHVFRHGMLLSRMVERRNELGIPQVKPDEQDLKASERDTHTAFIHAVLFDHLKLE